MPQKLQSAEKSSCNNCGMHLHVSNSWETGANHLPSETWNTFQENVHGLRMFWVSPPTIFRKEEMNILARVKSKLKNEISYNLYRIVSTWTMKYQAHSNPHCLNTELCSQLQKRLLNLDKTTTCNNMQRHATTCDDMQWHVTSSNKCIRKRRAFCDSAHGQFNITEDPLTSSSFKV